MEPTAWRWPDSPLRASAVTSTLIGLAAVVALGIVAGIFPAVQAMRLRIAEALRRAA